MEIDYKKVGKRIKSRRRELSLTQLKLAEMCDISTVYVSHVENGTATPSLDVFFRLVDGLGVTPDYFLTDTPFSSTEYIKDEIAKKLNKCNDKSLRIVSKTIDTLLDEQAD